MSVDERFQASIDRNGPIPEEAPHLGPCWIWTGNIRRGYGLFSYARHGAMGAHRWSYQLYVGPIPEGLVLDHLCRVRACVNPAHLEPVTQRENVMRGASVVAVNVTLTHCLNGHEFSPENTYSSPSKPRKRKCRICQREMRRRYKARLRGSK